MYASTELHVWTQFIVLVHLFVVHEAIPVPSYFCRPPLVTLINGIELFYRSRLNSKLRSDTDVSERVEVRLVGICEQSVGSGPPLSPTPYCRNIASSSPRVFGGIFG
jgi:hypothetical protein